MSDSTATAASTVAASDTAALLIFIIPRIISITAENLSEKSFMLAMALISESHLRKSRLCENAAIKWHHMMNRETMLAQGHDLVTETSCN